MKINFPKTEEEMFHELARQALIRGEGYVTPTDMNTLYRLAEKIGLSYDDKSHDDVLLSDYTSNE